jgi:hypothetical protein
MTRARHVREAAGGSMRHALSLVPSIYFTGFPSTKVQILTRRKALQTVASSTAFKCIRWSWIQYLYFCVFEASNASNESSGCIWMRPRAPHPNASAGSARYFTCFTSTKVLILTQKVLQASSSTASKCIRWIRQILVSHESKYAALAQRHGAARAAGRQPAPSASVFVLLY